MRIDMGILIEQMIMFFIIMGCGFAGAKVKLLTPEILHSLSRLIMVIISPMMVLTAFPPAVQNGDAGKIALTVMPLCVAMYVGLSVFSFFLSTVLGFHGDKKRIVMAQCLFGNLGFFGLPLVKEIFDPIGVVAFSFCIIIDSLFIWTEGVILTSGTGGEQGLSVKLLLRKLANPVMAGVIVGLILMALHVSPESLVLQSFDTIGDCAKPLALIYIGGTIAGMKPGALKNAWPTAFVIVLKMVAMPIVAYKLMTYFGVSEIARETLVLILALPSMASLPVMAENFGSTESEYAAQGVFIITLASLVTIPFVVSVLGA